MPRSGAPSPAPEASRLPSTWAGEKFAETHRERVAARGYGGRRGFEVHRGSSGLAAPGRRAARLARPQPLGCCVPARECEPPARGTPALTLWVPSLLGDFLSPLHSYFTAKVSPFSSCGRQNAHARPKGCGERTFRRRCCSAEARDASISRWCCGPRHLSQSCLGVPGS